MRAETGSTPDARLVALKGETVKLLGYQIRVLLGAVLLAAPAITVAQTPPVRAKRAYPAGPRRAPLQRRQLAASPRRFSAQGTVNESEPNNDYTTANLVALGDTASGTIDPAGDVDFYAVDVPADTLLVLDVQANNVGSALDPILELFDTDGTTLLAYNDDYNGLDSHIELHSHSPSTSTTGRCDDAVRGVVWLALRHDRGRYGRALRDGRTPRRAGRTKRKRVYLLRWPRHAVRRRRGWARGPARGRAGNGRLGLCRPDHARRPALDLRQLHAAGFVRDRARRRPRRGRVGGHVPRARDPPP